MTLSNCCNINYTMTVAEIAVSPTTGRVGYIPETRKGSEIVCQSAPIRRNSVLTH
jgi:hypothetical protein